MRRNPLHLDLLRELADTCGRTADDLYAGWWGYPSAYPFYGPPLYWAPQPNLGEVKLQSAAKDTQVYLDKAYAGTASKLK